MSLLFLIGKISGIIMFIIGFVLNYKIEKRRFNRRSITGLPVFRSYEHSWTTRYGEAIVKLVAVALIIFGAMIFIASFMVPPRIKTVHQQEHHI